MNKGENKIWLAAECDHHQIFHCKYCRKEKEAADGEAKEDEGE